MEWVKKHLGLTSLFGLVAGLAVLSIGYSVKYLMEHSNDANTDK